MARISNPVRQIISSDNHWGTVRVKWTWIVPSRVFQSLCSHDSYSNLASEAAVMSYQAKGYLNKQNIGEDSDGSAKWTYGGIPLFPHKRNIPKMYNYGSSEIPFWSFLTVRIDQKPGRWCQERSERSATARNDQERSKIIRRQE